MKKRKTKRPNRKDCRWLDRYFGDVCRAAPGIVKLPTGVTVCFEPPCKPCKTCGYQPITPKTPAWDDQGDKGVPS